VRREDAYRAAKAGWLAQHLDDARQWWIASTGLAPVDSVAAEPRHYAGPWDIASGWALDLYTGRVSRVHHDVDVVIGRADQLALWAYLTARGWKLVTPLDGTLRP
jgi:hypothetical protein